MATARVKIELGDVVALRKPHPCGANEWEILRVGMDVRLECRNCHRKMMVSRAEFEKRYREHLDGRE